MVFSGSSGFLHQYLKIHRHDIAEIFLKVALSTIKQKNKQIKYSEYIYIIIMEMSSNDNSIGGVMVSVLV
jgi:hypothetical protein